MANQSWQWGGEQASTPTVTNGAGATSAQQARNWVTAQGKQMQKPLTTTAASWTQGDAWDGQTWDESQSWDNDSQGWDQSSGQDAASWNGQGQAAAVEDDGKTFYAFDKSNGASGNQAFTTLAGEYTEEGVNHGRKYYTKTMKGIQGEVSAYLYYWDERDGPQLNGWWFGDTVGGRQVWARNPDGSPRPPQSGWCIPWDGEAQEEFQVTGLSGKRAHEARIASEMMRKRQLEAAAEKRRQQIWQWQQRLNSCAAHVKSVEDAAAPNLAQIEHFTDGNAELPAIDAVLNPLKAQVPTAVAAMRVCVNEARVIVQNAPELKDEMASLSSRCTAVQHKIKDGILALTSVRSSKMKAVEEAKKRELMEARNRELEPVQMQRLSEIVESAYNRLTFAEEEVEKVTIASAPLEVEAGEDLESMMMEAVAETEARFEAAQAAIEELKGILTSAQKEYSQFVPKAKSAAQEQFKEAAEKFKEFISKIGMYKNVRKDYLQRAKDKTLIHELSEKVAHMEVQLDQVETAAMETQEEVKEVERSINAVQSQLKIASQKLGKKVNEITGLGTGAMKDQATELLQRTEEMNERVDKALAHLKSMRVRILAETLMQEVGRKVRVVEDGLTRLAELTLPELAEELSPEEMKRTCAEAESVLTSSKTSLAEAQAYVAMKMGEARKLAETTGSQIVEEMEAVKQKLLQDKAQLEEYRTTLGERTQASLLKEVESTTEEAEQKEQVLLEAASSLDEAVSGEAAVAELQEALGSAIEAEQGAKASLVKANQALVAKAAELKKAGAPGSSNEHEITKMQYRQAVVASAIVQHAEVVKRLEKRFRIKDLLLEIVEKLEQGEAEAEKITETTLTFGEEEPSAEACKEVETLAKSAHLKLFTTMKLVDLKLRGARGLFNEELQLLRARITRSMENLDSSTNSAKEHQERSVVVELVEVVRQKVEAAEASIQRAQEAHQPFVSEPDDPEFDMASAFEAFEPILAEGESALDAAQVAIRDQLAKGASLSKLSLEKVSEELSALQSRLEEPSAQLADVRSIADEYRRANRSQVLSTMVSSVEAAVAKLKEIVGKIETDDQLVALSEDEVASLRVDLEAADKGAQGTMAKAKEYVAGQLNEARALSGQDRQQATKEVSQAQSKLIQTGVEMAKLSSKCRESDQRFASQGVLKAVATAVLKSQNDSAVAASIGVPLVEKANTSKVVGSMMLQDLVIALEVYMASAAMDLETLCTKLSGSERVRKSEFISFAGKLFETTGVKELDFDDKQCMDMFAGLEGDIEDTFEMESFKQLFFPRYRCIEQTPIWSSQEGDDEAGILEVDEVVRLCTALDGDTRTQCILGRDGSRVWLTSSNSEGAASLEVSASAAWQTESASAFLTAAHARCGKAVEDIDNQLKQFKDAPASIKAKLTSHRRTLTSEQAKIMNHKKQVEGLAKSISDGREKAKKAAADEKMKQVVLVEVSAVTSRLEELEKKVLDFVETLKSKNLAKDFTIFELISLKQKGEDSIKGAAEAKVMINKALKMQEDLPTLIRSQLREVRLDCAKLTARASTVERKAHASIKPVANAYNDLVCAEVDKARTMLRNAFRKGNLEASKLFAEVAPEGGNMSRDQFDIAISKIPEAGLSAEQVSILFQDIGDDRIDRLAFAGLVEEFLECDKGVVITKDFDIKDNDIVRRLEKGEVVKVIEDPPTSADCDMKRAKCCAIKDGAIGWISICGNKGATFMKPAKKPLKVCKKESSLMEAFERASAELSVITDGEVFELLEGPRETTLAAEIHCNGSALDKKGWITLSDSAGVQYASTNTNFYKCIGATALTDGHNLDKCTPLRKIEVGEILEVAETDEKPSGAVQRVYVKASKDGKLGWATVQGSRGTIFLEPETQYKVERSVALRLAQGVDSKVLLQLEPGTVFKPAGSPKEGKAPVVVGFRVCSEDGLRTGWVISNSLEASPLVAPG